MKGRSTGKNHRAGQSALEIVVALGILALSMSAIITVVFGGQSVTVDTETNGEALLIAQTALEGARASAMGNFPGLASATGTQTIGSIAYTKQLTVADADSTLCRKQATSTVIWNATSSRPQRVDLSTVFTDVAGAIAVGGDCAASPPDSNWDHPTTFASSNFNPGKPTAIDALNKIVYMGGDKTPFLFVADARSAVFGQSSGLFVSFANGFVASTTVNDIDVAAWQDPGSGATKQYAYAAMDQATGQLAVIDVTDFKNPVLVAQRSFSSCVAGSYPEGWRVFYYKDRLYMTTRETAGPEFHIFDVSQPTNPVELGSGACLGTNIATTVNGIAVRDQMVGGATKRFAYLATSDDNPELRVLDVTDPLSIAIAGISAANQNLPGNQNGMSVYLVSNKLYFGRQSAPSGPDLYVFDVANPNSGLPQLAAKDIGTGVTGIVVAGRFAFLGTPKSSEELQIWNITNLASITKIASWNFPQVIESGLDYEHDFVYATAQGNDALRIVYSP